jgi:RNA polymerase sigma factor (sigma-70 family)
MFQRRRKNYRLLDDPELVALYKAYGDSDSFGVLYERYGHLVMGVCLKYLKDEFEAEDLTSKIFEELGQKIRKHTIEHFKGWLYQVTRNECLMFLRKNKPYFVREGKFELAATEDTGKPEAEIQLTLLESALPQLKSDQEKCLRLFYLEDKSYNEVSQLLHMDLKQVKSAIQNGKRNLKLILTQHDEFRQAAQ